MANKIVGHESSGLLLLMSPAFFSVLPLDFNYTLEAQILMAVYGLVVMAAGIIARGARYFQWTVSLASMSGLMLLIIGPLTFYPIGYEAWRIFAYITLMSLGVTSLALVYLTRT
jgi:hypothetical protein